MFESKLLTDTIQAILPMIMARVPLPSPGDPQVAFRGACLGLPGALLPPRGPQGRVGSTRHDAVSTETVQESQAPSVTRPRRWRWKQGILLS